MYRHERNILENEQKQQPIDNSSLHCRLVFASIPSNNIGLTVLFIVLVARQAIALGNYWRTSVKGYFQCIHTAGKI